MYITKTGRLATQNRQHIKPKQISAEQYLHEQLRKHIKTDPLENIHTQLKKQPTAINIINNIDSGTHTINITYNLTTTHKEQDNNQ